MKRRLAWAALCSAVMISLAALAPATASSTRTAVGNYGRFDPTYNASVDPGPPPGIQGTTERVDLHLCETESRSYVPEASLTKSNTSCGFAISPGEISVSVSGSDASGRTLGGLIVFTNGNGNYPETVIGVHDGGPGSGEEIGSPVAFCGSISDVAIHAGATWVDIQWGSGSVRHVNDDIPLNSECSGVRTQGTVTVVFAGT